MYWACYLVEDFAKAWIPHLVPHQALRPPARLVPEKRTTPNPPKLMPAGCAKGFSKVHGSGKAPVADWCSYASS